MPISEGFAQKLRNAFLSFVMSVRIKQRGSL